MHLLIYGATLQGKKMSMQSIWHISLSPFSLHHAMFSTEAGVTMLIATVPAAVMPFYPKRVYHIAL
jgi:hypothetical protein